MNPVVVIGINHHNTLGVIRALGRAGLKNVLYVILVGRKGFVSKSKYIDKSRLIVVPSDFELLDALETLPINEKGVIVCCSDSSAAEVDRHRSQLLEKYYIPGIEKDNGTLSELLDKRKQCSVAEEVGLNIPTGMILDSNETVDFDNYKFFPIIIKPLDSVSGSKNDISIINNKDQLLEQVKKLKKGKYLIQEYIEKTDEFQLIGCSLNGGEDIIIPGYTRIIRQPDNTNTGFLEFKPINDGFNDDTLEKSKLFVKSLGYSGLFSVEYIRDVKGIDYFLEINMRNDGNGIAVIDAGCNLPYIWYAGNTGISDELYNKRDVRHILVIPEFDDFILVLKRKVSLIQWLKDIKRSDSYMEYSHDDVAPFYNRLFGFVSFLFKKSIESVCGVFKK